MAPNNGTDDFIEKKLTPEMIRQIQNKEANLILSVLNEGDISDFELNHIENLLLKYNIPFEQFLLLHDCFMLPETKFETKYAKTHLLGKAHEAEKLFKENKLNLYIGGNRDYRFHFPIRVFRDHRLKLFEQLFLYDDNFVKGNLVSFDIDIMDNFKSVNYYFQNMNSPNLKLFPLN